MKQLVAAALFLTLLLVFGVTLWSAEGPPVVKATNVGSEVCKACHAPQFEKFSQTMMGKIFLFIYINPSNERPLTRRNNVEGSGTAVA